MPRSRRLWRIYKERTFEGSSGKYSWLGKAEKGSRNPLSRGRWAGIRREAGTRGADSLPSRTPTFVFRSGPFTWSCGYWMKVLLSPAARGKDQEQDHTEDVPENESDDEDVSSTGDTLGEKKRSSVLRTLPGEI